MIPFLHKGDLVELLTSFKNPQQKLECSQLVGEVVRQTECEVLKAHDQDNRRVPSI